MTSEEIVRALRCVSAPGGGEKENCKNCQFYAKEQLGTALAEKLGVTEWTSCDCDAVGMAAADLIERLEGEKAALIEAANPRKLCEICKNDSYCYDARYGWNRCDDCSQYRDCPCANCLSHPKWEWKGLEGGNGTMHNKA